MLLCSCLEIGSHAFILPCVNHHHHGLTTMPPRTRLSSSGSSSPTTTLSLQPYEGPMLASEEEEELGPAVEGGG